MKWHENETIYPQTGDLHLHAGLEKNMVPACPLVKQLSNFACLRALPYLLRSLNGWHKSSLRSFFLDELAEKVSWMKGNPSCQGQTDTIFSSPVA